MHRTLAHLKQLDASSPVDRKLLVGPDLRWGRELLRTLARETGGWIGWEAATPRMLADEMAFLTFSGTGFRVGDDLEIATISEAALEAALAEGSLSKSFAALAGRPGIRRAVHDAIQNLRMSGVSITEVEERAPAGTVAADLAAILGHYRKLMFGERLMDPADSFHYALEAFKDEARYVLTPLVVVDSGLSLRGLRGQFVIELLHTGAIPLEAEPVPGMDVPPHTVAHRARIIPRIEREPVRVPQLFSATTPATELREVLRRVLDGGLGWGDVEIAATDEDRYGVELEAVTARLGIPCTFRNGLPFERSRIGRAVARFLAFLSQGLPSDTLREALEAGELVSSDTAIPSARLARRLREEQVGWGRERFEQARERLAAGQSSRKRQHDDESVEAFDQRLKQWKRDGEVLGKLLHQLLGFLPPVPERGDFSEVTTTSGTLAGAVRRYLELLTPPRDEDGAERNLLERLIARLEVLGRVGNRQVGFAGAVAELQAVLRELRWWPDQRGGRPGASSGDAIHFTGLSHAGLTGRKATFVAGLDADRVTGARVQDALLPDSVRNALDPEALPSLSARQEEQAWKLARAIERLSGEVTLSYAVRGSDTGGASGPSLLMLEAFRRSRDDESLDYVALRKHLGEPVSAIPAKVAACLDQRDTWLASIAEGSLLLDGRAQVREAFPALERGLSLHADLGAGEFRPVHGLVTDPSGLDPSANTRPVSASQLETLARCPLAWFYQYGLDVRPPEEKEYDPDAWLSAKDRGSLLHKVYEMIGEEYQGRRADLESDPSLERIAAIAEACIEDWRRKIPPPSEAVFLAEAEEIRRAAVEFRSCEIEDYERTGADPIRFEMKVYPSAALNFPAGDRNLLVYGTIDRVDELPDGRLRVVDFKTGGAGAYEKSAKGPFHGGRHLQAGIYAAIAEQQLGVTVDRFEYRFPTLKGGNHIAEYPREELELTSGIVASLLEHPRTGAFVPTSDKKDCTYCDAAPICRIRLGAHHGIDSAPRAEWADEHCTMLDVFDGMRRRRGEE